MYGHHHLWLLGGAHAVRASYGVDILAGALLTRVCRIKSISCSDGAELP